MMHSSRWVHLFAATSISCGPLLTDLASEPPQQTTILAACPEEGCTTVIFSDGFSNGLDQWIETGNGYFTTGGLHETTGYAGAGAPVAHASACDVGCELRRSNIDLSKANSATLKFRRFVDSAFGPYDDFGPYVCAGEYCTYLAKWYGGFGDDNVWHDETFDLEPFVGAPAFELRFITESSYANRIVQIDDVEVLIDAPVCGDHACERAETCSSCAADCGVCAPGTTIYSDNFQNIRRWTESGDGNWHLSGLGWYGSGYPATSSPPVARARNCDNHCTLESSVIDLSGVGSASLSFLRFVESNLGPGEFLKVEAYDGNTWQTLVEWTDGQGDTRRWTTENLDISTYAGSAQFQVRFVTKSASSNDDVIIDSLAITVDPVAVGEPDSDGDRLPDAVETNTGIFLSSSDAGTDPNNADTDGDFIFDGDEALGTSSGLDLPSMGASPVRKNILIEFDWFEDAIDCNPHSHRPTASAIARFTDAFANAPLNNPDGTLGITVISDFGQGGLFTGGSTVSDANGEVIGDVRHAEFDQIKAAHFAPTRNGYFHYVLLPHSFGEGSHSGAADINGDDMIVSLACNANNIFVAHTIMHELGHNLGLRHGGFESRQGKPNYNSVMNYRYQLDGVDTDCDAEGDFVLDYSHGTRIDLYEPALVEGDGVCGANTVAIDWNENGIIDASDVTVDLDGSDGTSSPLLQDFDDWAAIHFDGIVRAEDATVFGPLSLRAETCLNPSFDP